MQRIITNTTRRIAMGARRTTCTPSPVQPMISCGARRGVHSIARTGAIVAASSRAIMMATTAAAIGAATAAVWMSQHDTVANAAPREHESQEEDTYVREPKNDDELRRLLQSGKDVLLEIYDGTLHPVRHSMDHVTDMVWCVNTIEECVNCALLGAILRQTSFAVNEVPGLVIAKVNDKVPAVRYDSIPHSFFSRLIMRSYT